MLTLLLDPLARVASPHVNSVIVRPLVWLPPLMLTLLLLDSRLPLHCLTVAPPSNWRCDVGSVQSLDEESCTQNKLNVERKVNVAIKNFGHSSFVFQTYFNLYDSSSLSI
jgi:hypothetical protein